MNHASKLFINLNAKKLFILRKAIKMMSEAFRGKSIFPKKKLCVHEQYITHANKNTRRDRWMDGWVEDEEKLFHSVCNLIRYILFMYMMMLLLLWWNTDVSIVRWVICFSIGASLLLVVRNEDEKYKWISLVFTTLFSVVGMKMKYEGLMTVRLKFYFWIG